MKKTHVFLASACCAFALGVASADAVYMCGGTYTNKPTKGCSRVSLKPISVIGSPSYTRSAPASRGAAGVKNTNLTRSSGGKASAQTAGRYPTETPAENTNRMQGRLTILQAELTAEKKALAQAQTNLNSAKGSPNQQALQSQVIDRQKNIEAIEREIARAR